MTEQEVLLAFRVAHAVNHFQYGDGYITGYRFDDEHAVTKVEVQFLDGTKHTFYNRRLYELSLSSA